MPADVPDPAARPGWVAVDLKACALNWHDVLLRRGQYPHFGLPRIPGSDGAGVRSDTGEPVIVAPGLFWGDRDDVPAPEFEILGDRTDGTYAERVLVPEDHLRPLPDGWSWTDAAALPLAGLTAYRALFTRGGTTAGETVVVLGAGGGVATTAIGLARLAGARVLVTTSTPAKLARAREVGADDGVLYTEDGWAARLRALTAEGADVVIDSVGATWPQALEVLRPGGRLVTFGATGGARAAVDVRRFYFGQQTILGTTMGSLRDLDGLLALLRDHPSWRPVVHDVLPLSSAAEAHARMERREHVGKFVLDTEHTA